MIKQHSDGTGRAFVRLTNEDRSTGNLTDRKFDRMFLITIR